MNAETQKASVLRMLVDSPRCGTDFLEHHIPRYSARIWELKREGHKIIKWRCNSPRHSSRQFMYKLVP